MKNISPENKKSFIALHKILITTPFPNIEIILIIICTLLSSNTSDERWFSVLKRIKIFEIIFNPNENVRFINAESEIVRDIM